MLRSKASDNEIDAHAILNEFSQRTKRLEERLVDQKVKLEIYELRQRREGENRSPISTRVESPNVDRVLPEKQFPQPSRVVPPPMIPLGEVSDSPIKTELVRSENEALRFVLESGNRGATAREIQARIGLSREHSARMMNNLFRRGLVERNSEARPFTYRITEKGRQALTTR